MNRHRDGREPEPAPPSREVPPAQLQQVLILAVDALRAVVRDDWDSAFDAVDNIDVLAGGPGLGLMLTVIADWFLSAVRPPGVDASTLVQPAWLDEETGAELDASQVDAASAWAGRFLAARAAKNHDMCQDLITAFPDDPDESTRYYAAFLYACSGPFGVEGA